MKNYKIIFCCLVSSLLSSAQPIEDFVDIYGELTQQWSERQYMQPAGFGTIFRDLEVCEWPLLPDSHEWRILPDNSVRLFVHTSARPHQVEFVTYPSQTPDRYNFLSRWDGMTHHSFARTRTPPLNNDAWRAIYPIGAKGYVLEGRTYDRGHCNDFADTCGVNNDTPAPQITINPAISTLDPRNFIPEPPATHWGRSLRNCLVQDIRGAGGTYAQYVHYSLNPHRTADGTAVPEGVFFVDHARAGAPVRIYDVRWNDPIHNARAEGTTWQQRLAPLARADNFRPKPFVHDMRRPIAERLIELIVDTPLIMPPLNPDTRFQVYQAADHEVRNVAGKVQLCHDLIVRGAQPIFIESWIVRLLDHATRIANLDRAERFVSDNAIQQLSLDVHAAANVDADHRLVDHLRQIMADHQEGPRRNPHRAVRGPAPALRQHPVVVLPVMNMDNFPKITPQMYRTLIAHLRLSHGVRLENLATRRADLIAERIRAEIPVAQLRQIVVEYTLPPLKKFNVQKRFSDRGIPARSPAIAFAPL